MLPSLNFGMIIGLLREPGVMPSSRHFLHRRVRGFEYSSLQFFRSAGKPSGPVPAVADNSEIAARSPYHSEDGKEE